MLPSFRLIVATFLCGFAVAYAGLRVAVSLDGALPTAHAGLHVLPTAEGEVRVASMPAMFDARFAVSATPAVPGRAMPLLSERPSLSVVPPQDAAAENAVPTTAATEPSDQPGKPESVLATVQPVPPADPVVTTNAVPPALPDASPSPDPQQ